MLVEDRNIGKALTELSQYHDLVWDLETTGLNPYLGHHIVGIVAGPRERGIGWDYYFPFRHLAGSNLDLEHMRSVFDMLAHTGSLTGHNSVLFDSQFTGNEDRTLCEKLVLSDAILQVDTIIMAMLDDENRPSFKLEELCKEFDPFAGEAEKQLLTALTRIGHTGKGAKAHMNELPAIAVEPYACGDIRNTRNLYHYLLPSLMRQGDVYGLLAEMCRYARLLSRMRRTGLHMDRTRLVEQRAHTSRIEAELLEQIHRSAGFGINPRSPQQLGRWLGMKSTSKEALKASGDPRADMLINYRRAQKAISTYIDPILERMDPGDIIHPQLNLTRDPRDRGGTRSGRLSCSDPNFQALTDPVRDPLNLYGIRRCVTPRRPDRVFIGADYDKMEVIMAGAYSGDPYIAEMYYNGSDIYADMAKDWRVDRKAAKISFLALQYGIGPWKLGNQLGISETDAWYVREAFRDRHPKIHQTMQLESQNAERTGFLTLWTGRIIHFDDELTRYYAAWNRRIQGSCAEVIRHAMQTMEPMLDQYDAELVLQVHDELWVEAPREVAPTVAKIMEAVMGGFYEWKLAPRATAHIGEDGSQLKG